jgi:cysteine desulfurase / selenocysteine lyase
MRVRIAQGGMPAADVKAALAAHRSDNCAGINVSVSSIASTRLAFDTQRLAEVVRASPHYYNTEAEIDEFVRALHGMINSSGHTV